MSTRGRRTGYGLATLGAIASVLALTGPTVAAERFSIEVSTAPQIPQDIWISGKGNNTDGWTGGGVICLGVLAQGIQKGQRATLKGDVVEAGFVGVDGTPTDFLGRPISFQTYTAPSDQFGPLTFTVTPGVTFFIILDITVQNSTIPSLPAGSKTKLMLTGDVPNLGHSTPTFVSWFDVGNDEFFPFLNEGPMMANIRLIP